jgi:hypothetical protein
MGDAVRSMAVLAGLIIAVALFFSFGRTDVDPLPPAVDYESVVDHVGETYPYEVLAPASVPDEWRATSVEHSADERANRWRVGFAIGTTGHVGLEQSDGEVQSFLAERLSDHREDGTTTIDGETWERRVADGRNPDRALVLSGDAVTIVLGPEPYEVLEQFAAGLETVDGSGR